jgi:hypothetical protein
MERDYGFLKELKVDKLIVSVVEIQYVFLKQLRTAHNCTFIRSVFFICLLPCQPNKGGVSSAQTFKRKT